ncbi:MAG: MBL fold metallo-hydrolase [Sporolactobacillus sp.]
MRVRHYDHFYQLTFFPTLFPVNCYLVDEGETLTLIDAALPFAGKSILRAAQRVGKPITRIVLTHAHNDHVGALDELTAALSGVEVAISARDARLLAGDASLEAEEPQAPIRGGIPQHITTRPSRLLGSGDGIGHLTVITAPGHTPGHIALLDARSGALFAGDAFQVRGGLAVSGQLKWRFPFPALATWHREVACRSAKALLACRAQYLAVGHGRILIHPEQKMTRAVEQAEAALCKENS